MDSNIPVSPAYGVYVSRLVAFARACSDFDQFEYRHKILVTKLLKQGYSAKRLHSTFVKFTQNHNNLVSKYQRDLQAHIHSILSKTKNVS